MKARRTKTEAKPITITAERLSDNSRITFTISSDKTIEQLRALLNHHLPPLSPGKFDLYSYQRGALIHFHPSSFKLDYFPVIFDQQILLLKMDDRLRNNMNSETNKTQSRKNRFYLNSKKDKCNLINDCSTIKSSPSTTRSNKSVQQQQQQQEQTPSCSSSSSTVTCLTILKQLFHQSSSNVVDTTPDANVLTY